MRSLSPLLERLYSKYAVPAYLNSDPLEYPRRYSELLDQEAIGLVSALLAYGKVAQIRRSVESLLERMASISSSPKEFVMLCSRPGLAAEPARALQGFVHRFNTGEDIQVLFRLLERSWETHGSLGAHLASGLTQADRTFEAALSRLIRDWFCWAGEWGLERSSSFSYFLTSPEKGSCCKRWCMLIRWFGRQDALDLGSWMHFGLRPDQLVMPLDTHTSRISRYLGLTRRSSTDWKCALEVTEALRLFAPQDPVRFDFALSRLGILDLCQKRPDMKICEPCEMAPECRQARPPSVKRPRRRSP